MPSRRRYVSSGCFRHPSKARSSTGSPLESGNHCLSGVPNEHCDFAEMKLPNAQSATVREAKITRYLLNPAHPVGGRKAAFFLRFGFTSPTALRYIRSYPAAAAATKT